MAEPSAFFQQTPLPQVDAAAPPQLKGGATAAFSVAEWKQEALNFQQRLDGMLLESASQPANGVAHRGPPAVPAEAPPVGPTVAACCDCLDASDLHLSSLQTEVLRQLVVEQGAQQQQQQQQQQQHPLLQWPELAELLALPPLLFPGLPLLPSGAESTSGPLPASGTALGRKKPGKQAPAGQKRRRQMEEGQGMKPERAALQELYRQRAEAARQGREQQHAAASKLLASLAGSTLEPSLTWKVFQDGRSRQLQLVAQAAAEASEAAAAAESGAGPSIAVDRVSAEEAVLHVCLHIPQAHHLVSEEWLVLGSTCLAELRDRLSCVGDKNALAMELEENAKRQREGQAPLCFARPSAYFYIEGTFYNDLRQPGAADYSAPILQYNREHGVQAPPHPLPGSRRTDVLTTGECAFLQLRLKFSSARMEATRFADLWLRLGAAAANLYCHQGGCEHLLTFQDVRLFDGSCDPPLRRQYPFRITPPQQLMMRDCEVCGCRVAKRVTYDDRAAPHTPFFWCEECFVSMHYDHQASAAPGRALYTDFRVFPYTCEHPPSIYQRGAPSSAPHA
ncbi:snRNA-activating protein complex subunit [Chlorella vulgaris]